MNALELRRRTLGKGVYKKTVEGNPAIAQGSLARRYPGITMQGWTEQAQYEGKNLLDLYSWESVDRNNAVWNIGSEKRVQLYVKDESVTLNENICLYLNGTNADWIITKGTLSKSYVVSDEDHPALYMQPATKETAQAILSKYNIMVSEGGSEIPYEPYTGGQPSPNPDYKQDVKNAGKYDEGTGKYQYEVKLTGANLFDGSQFGQSGKVLHVESTSGNRNITGIDYKQNTAYTISIESYEIITHPPSGDWSVNFTIYYTDGSKDQKYTKYLRGIPLTSNKNKTIRRMVIENPWNVEEKITGIMINEGADALPYEPYRTPQTVTLTADRPLTKWDKLEKREGQWGWVYKSEEIESYTDESVPGEYFSTTGQLSTGAQVWYETTTETFVPLTASEQEAMNALYTFRPTTVLSNDCECEMTLTYKTKKSLEVTD